MGQCCIIVDKQPRDYDAVRRLAMKRTPLSSAYLEGYDDLGRPDVNGSPPVIAPGSYPLEPI